MNGPGAIPGGGHFLDQDSRRRVTLQAARRRAVLARFGRLAFFAALVAVAAPVGYFMLRPSPQADGDAPEAGLEGEAGVQRATNLHLSGHDSAGNPFEIRAETAVRRADGTGGLTEGLICSLISNPAVGDGRDTQVDADRCIYDPEARILNLDSNVDLSTNDGYVFRTSHARVHIDGRRAEGDMPVEAAGPSASVRADRWSYMEDGGILHFEGNVQSVIRTGGGAAEDGEQ